MGTDRRMMRLGDANPTMRRVPVRRRSSPVRRPGVSFGVREDMADSSTASLPATRSDHVRVLHRQARTGAGAVVHRPRGRWVERAISLRGLPRDADSLTKGLDRCGSQGRFAGRRRVIVSLIAIDSTWPVLDCNRTGRHGASGPAAMLWSLIGHCDAERLRAPSYVLGTGRGARAVWLHGVLPRAALGRWQAVLSALQGRVAGFGADGRTRDAARVLRLVGTSNTKVEREVRCLYPAAKV